MKKNWSFTRDGEFCFINSVMTKKTTKKKKMTEKNDLNVNLKGEKINVLIQFTKSPYVSNYYFYSKQDNIPNVPTTPP